MSKKTGFTLAEVLITLGIIGVVAALTAPALVLSGKNEANAAKLSVVVSTLENAFNNAIVQEGVDTLFNTKMWQANTMQEFVGQLGAYLVISSHGDDASEFYTDPPTDMDPNGGKTQITHVYNIEIANAYRISLKNGAALFIRKNEIRFSEEQINTARSQGASITGNSGWLVVDVNGNASPNTAGRDIFMFIIGPNGMLYPRGGTDYHIYDSIVGGDAGVWNENGTDCCLVGSIMNGGLGCTARIIAEGYKMNY